MSVLNYWIGKSLHVAQEQLLLLRPPYLWSHFPYGSVPECDIARISGAQPMSLILDIGANTGQTAENYCRWFRQAVVHSFEPVTKNFEQLAKVAAKNKRVVANRMACGSVKGEQFLPYQCHSHLHSLATFRVAAASEQSPATGETISITTVDAYCDEQQIEHIDLLKSDTEGYDIEVLRGANRMLTDGRTRFVYVETGLNGQPNQSPFGEISQALFEKGFVLTGFYESMRGGARKEIVWFCNSLFTHTSVLGCPPELKMPRGRPCLASKR